MRTLVLSTLLAAAAAGAAEPPPTAEAPARVRLVDPGQASPSRAVAATVAAARRATLSTRVAASVRTVHVEEGDRVRAGQLLVSLAAEDLEAQLRAAEAALDAAAAQERRLVTLQAQGAATPVELEGARAQRAQADAAVRGVQAQLGYARIRAPFAGVVQARSVSAGDFVGPGAPLLTVDGAVGGEGLELHASLDGAEAQGLRQGQRLGFEAEGGRGEVEVTALGPGGDPVSHRSSLRARVVRAPAGLRTGAFARLLLPAVPGAAPVAGAVWVPRSALVQHGDLAGVFVVEDGLGVLRWLSLAETVGDQVHVRAGLRPGERVVAAPGNLRDGQRVEVAP